MSLVLYGGGIADAKGSVGGTTMARSRGGSTHRVKRSGTQAKTVARQQSKAILSVMSKHWAQNLTIANRNAWNAFALVNPSTNYFGHTVYLSGFNWFVRTNSNLQIGGIAYNATPPATTFCPGPTTLSITAVAAGNHITLTWTDAGAPLNPKWNVLVAINLSPGISYVRSQFKQLVIETTPASPHDIGTAYQAKYNVPLVAGKQVFVLMSYMDGDTGIQSPPLIASCIIS